MNVLEPLGVEEQEISENVSKDIERTEDSKDMFTDPIKIENDGVKELNSHNSSA